MFVGASDNSTDPALLPKHINYTFYDKYVVDPSNNRVYSDKPWMVMVYWHKCGFCVSFKPEFEKMAVKNTEVANWAYLDGFYEEYLKLTFKFV